MRILGLDYGSKRIGVAVSDENASFAMPRTILLNDDKIFAELAKIVDADEIEKIVLGDPGENLISDEVKNFGRSLGEKFLLPVIMEKEFMTSMHVSQAGGKKPIARKEKEEHGEKRDDSAAALILQRFLDRTRSKK